MKRLLTILAVLASSTVSFSQQCVLNTTNCNTLRAVLEAEPTYAETRSFVFSLEKELVPNVWEKTQEVVTNSTSVEFTVNGDKKYRATCFVKNPTAMGRSKSKIMAFKEKSNVEAANADGFISNVLDISDCLKIKKGFSFHVESKEDKITIVPNPANNTIFVENLEHSGFHSETAAAIYDTNGQLETKVALQPSNRVSIDISALKPGVYFIKFQADNGHFSVKKLLVHH